MLENMYVSEHDWPMLRVRDDSLQDRTLREVIIVQQNVGVWGRGRGNVHRNQESERLFQTRGYQIEDVPETTRPSELIWKSALL